MLVPPWVNAYIFPMAHAHTHVLHEGASLSAAAQGALERAGEQWTPMRKAVFEALQGFAKPASAYDVAEALSQVEGRRIAANSIYRILDLFVASNLARRVESSNAYVVNAHPDCQHDCIFLVCDGCGSVSHLDDDRLTRSIRDAANGSGFLADRPVIEVRGRCAECRSA